MRTPIPSTRRATPRTERAALALALSLLVAACPCRGQTPTPAAGREGGADEVAAMIMKMAAGGELLAEEREKLGRALPASEDGTAITAEREGIEIVPPGEAAERRIYILKTESRAEQTRELLELQRNLLRNQLTVLRVLGVIGKHQEVMGKRLSRTENLNRELLTGLQDTNHGVDMARVDTSSTLAETTDISEMTEELLQEVDEMQEQLEDIEAGLSGLQDTADEILKVTECIEGGGS